MTDKPKILIVKLSALGDLVHTWPAVRSLRERYPRAFIAWAVEERFQDLLALNPDIDLVVPLATKRWRKNPGLSSLGEIRAGARTLRDHRFDMTIDFNGLIKSGIVTWLSGAPVRLGFHRSQCREPLSALATNRRLPRQDAGRHVVELNLALARAAGASGEPGAPAAFNIPADSKELVAEFLAAHPETEGHPLAAVHAGAGYASKRWAPERFARLADRLVAELGFTVLLTWGSGEEDYVRSVGGMMNEAHLISPRTTLGDLAALCGRMNLLVCCDSGPLHLAAALGVPTLSIFGPTDPRRNGPYGPGHETVVKILPCSFCWKRACPLGTDECMKQVDVDEVFDTIRKNASRYATRQPH
jgi:lipopolysaccharide heptosyltransferase I